MGGQMLEANVVLKLKSGDVVGRMGGMVFGNNIHLDASEKG